jgi:hypothetical protein
MSASNVVGDVLIALLFIPSVAMAYGSFKLLGWARTQRRQQRAERPTPDP